MFFTSQNHANSYLNHLKINKSILYELIFLLSISSPFATHLKYTISELNIRYLRPPDLSILQFFFPRTTSCHRRFSRPSHLALDRCGIRSYYRYVGSLFMNQCSSGAVQFEKSYWFPCEMGLGHFEG